MSNDPKKLIELQDLLYHKDEEELSTESREKLTWCAANINRLPKAQRMEYIQLLRNFNYEIKSAGPNSVYISEYEFNENDVNILYSLVSGALGEKL